MDISKYRDNIELSDVSIVVGDHEYKLHKFPLSINCEYFKEQCKNQDHIVLKQFPGDWKYFEFIADHCYGKDFDINEGNVVILLCGAEFLGMHGKFNMIEKCQKVIDRIFRSVEYSKSIEFIIPILESTKKVENSNVQAIIDRGLKVIADLWLRHVSNYKSNFKEKYFEDALVLEKLLKLNSDWIVRLIEYCSTDENKYTYLGKLAVEYIKMEVINKLDDSTAQSPIIINDADKNTTGLNIKVGDSSSCSSINEELKSERSSSSYEKEAENPTKSENKCSSRENIGEIFDKIVFCLPNNMNLGKTVSVQWFQKCFDICDKYKCKSKNKFLKLCGGMLIETSIDEIKTLDPNTVTEMIEQILKDDQIDKDLMKWIWDNNILEMAKNDELDPSVFSKVVKNMPESQDVDPDVVFQIVLSILKKISDESDNREYQRDLIDCVKLEQISAENLEIAMDSKFWIVEDICKAAIQRLKINDKDSSTEKKKLNSYNTQYCTFDEASTECPNYYRYQSKIQPSWKCQASTNYLDFFPHGDEEDYPTKSYEPIHSYNPPYRQCHSTYSPDSYLTMEENLKCELKKISDSYINYYKDRSPLKSRRRYQYSVPYDI